MTTRPPGEGDALALLGLAHRAGAVATGVPAVREALRNDAARLVIMAGDASPGQLRKVRGLLEHRELPVRWVTTRDALGRALGRPGTSVVALTTHSFVEQLSSRLPTRPG
jgi:ribosomal protein L7Ae-like RNA K-turn-binding protein